MADHGVQAHQASWLSRLPCVVRGNTAAACQPNLLRGLCPCGEHSSLQGLSYHNMLPKLGPDSGYTAALQYLAYAY